MGTGCLFQFTYCEVKRCLRRVFYHFTMFKLKNAKNQLFKEIKRFECSFYGIEVQVITNPSSRLELETPDS